MWQYYGIQYCTSKYVTTTEGIYSHSVCLLLDDGDVAVCLYVVLYHTTKHTVLPFRKLNIFQLHVDAYITYTCTFNLIYIFVCEIVKKTTSKSRGKWETSGYSEKWVYSSALSIYGTKVDLLLFYKLYTCTAYLKSYWLLTKDVIWCIIQPTWIFLSLSFP